MNVEQFNKNDPNYLLEVVKALEQLRRGNKEDIKASQIIAVESGNRALSEINRYLFSLASILVTFLITFISFKELRANFLHGDRILLVYSLVFLALSLLSGLVHMVFEAAFYNLWLKDEDEKLKKWSSISFFPSDPTKIMNYIDEYDTIGKETRDISDDMIHTSPHLFLFTQGLFVFASLFLIVIVATKVLIFV